MLTDAQLQTLAAALRAETDQTVVAAMAIRNDVALRDWCNGASAEKSPAGHMSIKSRLNAYSLGLTKSTLGESA